MGADRRLSGAAMAAARPATVAEALKAIRAGQQAGRVAEPGRDRAGRALIAPDRGADSR